jgi:hypothetical protein
VPVEWLKQEWRKRGLLKHVQPSVSGCLGPCDVPNVVAIQRKQYGWETSQGEITINRCSTGPRAPRTWVARLTFQANCWFTCWRTRCRFDVSGHPRLSPQLTEPNGLPVDGPHGTNAVEEGAGFRRPAALPCLEVQLQGKLGYAAWLRLQDVSEGRIIDVAIYRVGTIELSMIQGVEGLETEFQ